MYCCSNTQFRDDIPAHKTSRLLLPVLLPLMYGFTPQVYSTQTFAVTTLSHNKLKKTPNVVSKTSLLQRGENASKETAVVTGQCEAL